MTKLSRAVGSAMFAGGCGSIFVGAPAWIVAMKSVHVGPVPRSRELDVATTELTARTLAMRPGKGFNILSERNDCIQEKKFELYTKIPPFRQETQGRLLRKVVYPRAGCREEK